MKLLITGARECWRPGQNRGPKSFAEMIANVAETRSYEKIWCKTKYELDTSHAGSVLRALEEFHPDVIVHCGAFAKPINLHEEQAERSNKQNIIGTSVLVDEVFYHQRRYKREVKLVFLSTDYVYPGIDGNYCETDPVKPINFYAQSKLAGEMAVSMLPNHLILRASIHDFPYPHQNVFCDLIKSPLWKDEAIPIILDLIEKDARGTFNLGGPTMSLFDFISQRQKDINPIYVVETPGKFPKNCSMNTDKMKEFLKDANNVSSSF